jgi:hypothetical protein
MDNLIKYGCGSAIILLFISYIGGGIIYLINYIKK